MDSAILSNIIDNLYPDDAISVLEEIKRILKKNGKLLVKLNPFISDEQIEEYGIKKISGNLLDDGMILWNNTNEEWEDIRQTVDGSYDKFSVRLLEAFPGLSMKDVYFCCLVKINVSIKDLSDIYCISRTSISRKKQRMKRDKLGLTENNETLDDFLRRF